MTSVQLPSPLEAFFAAMNAHNTEAALDCLADDAAVLDEGELMKGRRAISDWLNETSRKYGATVVPSRVEQGGTRTLVTAMVSGNFPGSPISLRYAFALSANKIANLEISQ